MDGDHNEYGQCETLSDSSSIHKLQAVSLTASSSSESLERVIFTDAENETNKIANGVGNMKLEVNQKDDMTKGSAIVRRKGKGKFKRRTDLLKDLSVARRLIFDIEEEEEEEDVEKEARILQTRTEQEQRKKTERDLGVEQGIVKKIQCLVEEEPSFLVSFANVYNTLHLTTEHIIIHEVTVSYVVDSHRVFIQNRMNPTFEGLQHLQDEMQSIFTIEQARPLSRPISPGSILGVFYQSKWLRCQVITYSSQDDTCDILFVDHGGYKTVPITHLRELKPEMLFLPFQTVQVYLDGINPSNDEKQTEIVAKCLFLGNISIQLLGCADDRIPIVQAFFYNIRGLLYPMNQATIDRERRRM